MSVLLGRCGNWDIRCGRVCTCRLIPWFVAWWHCRFLISTQNYLLFCTWVTKLFFANIFFKLYFSFLQAKHDNMSEVFFNKLNYFMQNIMRNKMWQSRTKQQHEIYININMNILHMCRERIIMYSLDEWSVFLFRYYWWWQCSKPVLWITCE